MKRVSNDTRLSFPQDYLSGQHFIMSSNEKALGVTGVPEPYDEKNYMDGTTHATVSAPLDGDAGGVVVQ